MNGMGIDPCHGTRKARARRHPTYRSQVRSLPVTIAPSSFSNDCRLVEHLRPPSESLPPTVRPLFWCAGLHIRTTYSLDRDALVRYRGAQEQLPSLVAEALCSSKIHVELPLFTISLRNYPRMTRLDSG